MKPDEKFLFIAVHYSTCKFPFVSVRDIVETLHEFGFIHYKRSLYLLRKWVKIGFYNYGVSILAGWVEHDKLPQRYLEIILNSNYRYSNLVKGDNTNE